MPRGALQGEPEILGTPPYERAPGDPCFVVAREPQGAAIAAAMRWGWPGPEPKRRRLHLRVDQLTGRRIGRMARCLVPVAGYVQPGFRRSRIGVTFAGTTSLAIAAVWKDGFGGPCFAILTTDANEDLAQALSRMPVLLPPSSWPMWLSGEPLGAADRALLAHPAPAAWLRAQALKAPPCPARSLSVARQIEAWAPGSTARPGAQRSNGTIRLAEVANAMG